MYRLFNIKHKIIIGFLCLIFTGCSYTPYRYSFSLVEPQSETMKYEDNNVQFRFVPSPENIWVEIKNKTDNDVYLVRDKAEYIGPSGESYRVLYGYDFAYEMIYFTQDNDLYVTPMRIDPSSEITGYVWKNNWPDFCIGQDRFSIASYQIDYLMEPFFPRYSFEGRGEDLKDSTFNLILPIDFDGYLTHYAFTFLIKDAEQDKVDL
ncbi:MAG: hypothetical protein ACE5KZ_15280 [Candidatus Scalinduaceae bacterium]